MAADLGEGVSSVAYHMKALASFGAAREMGLSPDGDSKLYESTVMGDSEVIELLEATEAEDEGRKAA
jgi:hypothetical protein